ncbi:hypothetical protein [Salinarchaeum sp. Harcht-Bsk1]|uniref:hypothetical protein n=1 Tax=Salinarchaeum sp. Harcht-Bsk1 TaxID=1333523 RepID=UPI000677B1C7|nr:hypothetical protein [Salinarchaeum sp. Harcht-Bsk1]
MANGWHRRELLRAGSLTAAGTLAGCLEDGASGSDAAPSDLDDVTADDGPQEFVSVSDTQFHLDGAPWYFNGAQYSSFYFTENESVAAEVLSDADSVGVDVVRTHCGCAGRGPVADRVEPYVLQPRPGELNEAAFELLDRAIARSKQYGMRWILWLANHWRIQGNGIAQYVQWATGDPIPEGGSLAPGRPTMTSEFAEYRDRFYTNAEAKRLYKEYVEQVLTRTNTVTGVEYRNDPSILLWELINEGQALPKNRSACLEWYEELSSFVSELAPDQLVGSGGLGT